MRFLLLLLLVLELGLSGCLWHGKKTKSETHIYAGDAPKMRMVDKPETAGGALNTY